MAVLAEVGSRAASVVPLDGIEPGQRIGPLSRSQPAVTIHPAIAAVVAGQHEGPAVTLAHGLVSFVEPAVERHHRPQCPPWVVRLRRAQAARVDLGHPVGSGGHELRQALGADRRASIHPPGAFLMHLSCERRHRRPQAPFGMGGAHQGAAVLLCSGRDACSIGAGHDEDADCEHQQDQGPQKQARFDHPDDRQVIACLGQPTLEAVHDYSPSVRPRMQASTIRARRSHAPTI